MLALEDEPPLPVQAFSLAATGHKHTHSGGLHAYKEGLAAPTSTKQLFPPRLQSIVSPTQRTKATAPDLQPLQGQNRASVCHQLQLTLTPRPPTALSDDYGTLRSAVPRLRASYLKRLRTHLRTLSRRKVSPKRFPLLLPSSACQEPLTCRPPPPLPSGRAQALLRRRGKAPSAQRSRPAAATAAAVAIAPQPHQHRRPTRPARHGGNPRRQP